MSRGDRLNQRLIRRYDHFPCNINRYETPGLHRDEVSPERQNRNRYQTRQTRMRNFITQEIPETHQTQMMTLSMARDPLTDSLQDHPQTRQTNRAREDLLTSHLRVRQEGIREVLQEDRHHQGHLDHRHHQGHLDHRHHLLPFRRLLRTLHQVLR